ncbi:S-adenosyl-L-methionine-dependent methyltransferase [Rhizophagus clarus]|uniref:S-adenosyl-L-methionine-dependent methyltransferase n=1 Tax=Rhizophagus clarus TaxID=94130 RepID=A0A8H3LHA9_9GLOM|nr:S-adenosyl-L-methionine-dependent methyltransferase [Rhizophagus clarus]
MLQKSFSLHRTIFSVKLFSFIKKYSTTSNQQPKSSAFTVFNRETKRMQRDRSSINIEESRKVDYLKDEIAYRMVDRLLDIKRKFNTIVDLGSGCGHIIKHIDKDMMKKLIMCDMSSKMLERDKDINYEVDVERMVVDEELLPFEENSLEAVISNLSLHWVNDLPGAMIQIQRSLKPDGVFIASILGGDTLFELRTSFQLAESEREGGISPRISPMTNTRDIGSLLSRAGFNLTTIDTDDVVVSYPSMFELIQDLRSMGESNAVLARRSFLKRDTLLAASAIYKELYGNPDGSIPATFQIIYMIGWKPDISQPKPLPRGSGQVSLKETLKSGIDKNFLKCNEQLYNSMKFIRLCNEIQSIAELLTKILTLMI